MKKLSVVLVLLVATGCNGWKQVSGDKGNDEMRICEYTSVKKKGGVHKWVRKCWTCDFAGCDWTEVW